MRAWFILGVLLTGSFLPVIGQAAESPSDIWVVSGQSNACGRAELPGYEEHPLVQMFDGRKWIAAKEPLPLGGTVGPWMAAATETAKGGVGVKICGWASGGQPISLWEEAGGGWKSLSGQIRAAGKNAGVFLWYQGESDAVNGYGPDKYLEVLQDLASRVRKEAGNPQMLTVIVQLATFGSGSSQRKTMDIREAQRQFVLKDPHAILVTAMGRECDGTHLKKDGYFELGREISRALLKTRYGKKDVDWPGPVLDAAVYGADGKSVLAHFAEAKKLTGLDAADFAVLDSQGVVNCTKVLGENTRIALTLERAVTPPAKLVYGYGNGPKATLVDEAGNRAPAVHLEIAKGPPPPDMETKAPNGAGAPASKVAGK
ncbi:MAG: hypothetical protein HY291_04280 [Planctomycetes bacterium]|nr:hypothetical protein [Planctomycetota bacterium]